MYEFEVVEEYMLHGERRFRLRVKGTRIIVNVPGESLEEAIERAKEVLEKVKADRIIG
ncbi:MAG: hypothetical protein GSR86_02920 [Desulfurococcales archaeon]|nr:hypothetical protein [Desulfurococcales archaeon]